MADPQVSGGIRVMAIQHKLSGLPEDVIVNSWAFRRGAEVSVEDAAEAAVFWLEGFYNSMASTFRPQSLVTPEIEFRVYDLEQPPPREPMFFEGEAPRAGAGTPNPEEAAVVLSFYSERNLPRNRGRVYIGPWMSGGNLVVEGNVRVHDSIVAAMAAAANQLARGPQVSGIEWCVLSQSDQALKPVTHGWVDNSWDTQRRRGPEPTARTLWDASEPP